MAISKIVSGSLSDNIDINGDLSVNGLEVNSNPIASAGSLSLRNKIINGNFDVWQRGTSGSSGYVADRWENALIGSTATISRQSFTLGQTDVPGEPAYFHRIVVTSSAGSGNYAVLRHKIEDVRIFANKEVNLSFYMKTDANKNIATEFVQVFGSGGSSAVTGIGSTTCALTTSWQKFSITATIPSISGKTIGNNNYVMVVFWFDAGSDWNSVTNSLGQQSGTFDIAQVQLEPGSTATPFEMRSIGQELALCQRYYYKVVSEVNYHIFAIAAADTTSRAIGDFKFPVTMRATPTMTSGGSFELAGNGNVTGASIGFYGNKTGGQITCLKTSSFLDGYAYQLIASNDASAFLSFDAEL